MPMLRHLSISLRLTLWFGSIFFLGCALFGVTMWANLKSTLTGERYQTLSRRAGRLEELLTINRAEAPEDRSTEFTDFARATGNGLSEVFRADGTRVFPSPSAAAKAFPWPPNQAGAPERFVEAKTAGQDYWILIEPVSSGGESLYLAIAAPESGNQLVLQRFVSGLLEAVPVLLLVASAGGYFLSRKALQPVDRITASARSISITNLSARLPASGTGDELQRLAETCNAMLDRLETSVNRMKQFTADASHDLRGPISFTRTVAEVALRRPGLDPDSRAAFQDIVDESSRAALLLEDMLTLARADSNAFHIALAPVNLVSVVEEACEKMRPLAVERGHSLTVETENAGPAMILGELSSLRRLFGILLDNAVKYTHSPGSIRVSLAATQEEATVTVHDTGIGISEADLPRIFDRFFRADPSRSLIEGNGLGLSIAKWIADKHHAGISAASSEHVGSTFRIAFPRLAG